MSGTEYTGGKVSYYEVDVLSPTREGRAPYTAECNDVIEALGMTFPEGEAFKAIWRKAAARMLATIKKGYDKGLYDAEKAAFYGSRMVVIEKLLQELSQGEPVESQAESKKEVTVSDGRPHTSPPVHIHVDPVGPDVEFDGGKRMPQIGQNGGDPHYDELPAMPVPYSPQSRNYGMHNSHCCREHGCKYNDPRCPVAFGDAKGIACESCTD